MPTRLIYAFAQNYRSLTVWECDPRTRSRICTHKFTPNKGLSRRERYDTLAKSLYSNFKIPAGVFMAKNPR